MMLRNISLIIFSMFLLSVAGGDTSSEKQGADGNGSMSDTSEVTGTVESVNLQDSMIVINSDEGKDTVYFNSETDFSTESADQILRLNTKLRVHYITKDDKKIATHIEPASADGETPNGEEDTSGTTPPSPGDTAGTTPPFPDGETPPME